MPIVSVEVAIAELANETLKTSYGSNVTTRRHVFVALTDDDGFRGYGEGSPLPHFSGERAEEMKSVIEAVLAPSFIGLDVFETEMAQLALERALPHHYASKAAMINALIDLQGKRIGMPAVSLLGGAITQRISVGGAVGIETQDAVKARVSSLWERGVRTLKVKIGSDVARDIETIRMLRGEFPENLEIRADANAGFTVPEAQSFLRAVVDLRLQYLEQPLRPHDRKGLAGLREYGTRIAADESLFSLADAFELAAERAVDVFIVKLIKLGGLHQARKVVALAEAAGIACVAVSPYETALGVAANLHLAASSTAFPFASELGVGVSSVVLEGADPVIFDDGFALLPLAPGLGVGLPETLFDAGAST